MAELIFSPTTFSSKPLSRLSGKVVHGRGIGKLVGTPTADVQIFPTQVLPSVGVYITILKWKNHKYASVTNVGNHPTIDTDTNISVETLILDFNSEIYGADVTIEFMKFLRLQQKFQTLSELREQIFCDCNTARMFFYSSSDNKQTSSADAHCIHFGSLFIDTLKRCATVNGHDLLLTTKEYDLLVFLCSHPGWAYSKEQLYEAIWHEPATDICHPVENLVCQLRKKLKGNQYENNTCIKTIIGYGYKFLPD